MRVIGRKWFALLTVDGWKGCLTGVQDKYFQNDEWGTGGIRSKEFEAVAVIEDFFFLRWNYWGLGFKFFIFIPNFGNRKISVSLTKLQI